MEISLFRSARDTQPQPWSGSWRELCELLGEASKLPQSRGDKLGHLALIPGVCDGRRANHNMRVISAVCGDIDISPNDPRYLSFADACAMLRRNGLKFIAYTTTKNCAAHNRYRLILPYEHAIDVSYHLAAWQTCNHRLSDRFDPATKDPARLSFLPAQWHGTVQDDRTGLPLAEPFNAFDFEVEGKPALTASELQALHSDHSPSAAHTASLSPHLPLSNIEMLRLGLGKDADAPFWKLIIPEDIRKSIVVPRWTLDALPQEEGNRDYRFMRAVASYAVRNNIPICAEAIEVLADCFSRDYLHREPSPDAARQSENALRWALRSSAYAGPCQPDADA